MGVNLGNPFESPRKNSEKKNQPWRKRSIVKTRKELLRAQTKENLDFIATQRVDRFSFAV